MGGFVIVVVVVLLCVFVAKTDVYIQALMTR